MRVFLPLFGLNHVRIMLGIVYSTSFMFLYTDFEIMRGNRRNCLNVRVEIFEGGKSFTEGVAVEVCYVVGVEYFVGENEVTEKGTI